MFRRIICLGSMRKEKKKVIVHFTLYIDVTSEPTMPFHNPFGFMKY